MATKSSNRTIRRLAWAALALIAVGVLVERTRHGAQAWSTPPSSFTVTQSSLVGPSVAPGDAVDFTIDLNLSASATNLIIQGTLDAGLKFAATPYDPPYTSLCSAPSGQTFTCSGIGAQGTGPIASLVLHTVVGNVTDGTTITQLAGSFSAKDGNAGLPVTAPASNLPTLTVSNESISVTDSMSAASVFEGGAVTHTIGLTNTGTGNSGAYDVTVTLTGGTVTNVVCPNGAAGSGSLSATATCTSQPGLAFSASASMTVSAIANDGATSTTNSVTITSSSGNNTGNPAGIKLATGAQSSPSSATSVSELALSGPASATTGQTVTLCTTNNPNDVNKVRSATNSGSASLLLGDFVLNASGGAAASGATLVTGSPCTANQQGVSFTSNTAGNVAVSANYNKTDPTHQGTTNTVTVSFGAASNPSPTLSSISPNSASVGANQFVMTLTGSNFINGSVVRWNGSDLATTYNSGTSLSATVPANLLATAGTATVTVFNPAPGGGTSPGQTFTINAQNNPVPTLANVTPNSAGVNSSTAVPIVVTGTNFVATSELRWNGVALTTDRTGIPTSLSASIPTSSLTTAGQFAITVFNPAPGGGTSQPQTFTVTAAPVITSLGTTTLPTGSAGFNLVVGGSNFTSQSKVKWNGAQLTTTFNTSSALTAAVPSGNLSAAGTAAVTVTTPGYPDSNSLTFTITAVATKLGFTTQPSGAVVATAFTAQPVVAIQDATSATMTGDNTTTITLALNGTGTLTCTGGLSKAVTAGVATFAGCAVDTAGTGFTITASATSLTAATSSAFEVTAAGPTQSAQLVVAAPAAGLKVARSRLVFSATTGTLAPAPTKVQFIIKRKSDGKYWNATSNAWQDALVLNDATAPATAGGSWTLAITGAARRLFVNTTVTVEARATVGTTVYSSQAIPELAIR